MHSCKLVEQSTRNTKENARTHTLTAHTRFETASRVDTGTVHTDADDKNENFEKRIEKQ